MTVGAFRQLIQPFVKRGLDEFKVLRNPESYRFELKNDRKTLAEYFVTNGTKLLIEDGKPLRRGETPVKFIFYNLATGDSPDTFLEPLFELLIPEDMTVYEVKGEVCRALVADTTLHQNLLTQLKRTYPTVSEFHFTPDTIRLREINYLSLSTARLSSLSVLPNATHSRGLFVCVVVCNGCDVGVHGLPNSRKCCTCVVARDDSGCRMVRKERT
jgi:hypothetical protein